MDKNNLQIGDFVWARMFGLTIRFELTSEAKSSTQEGLGYNGYNPIFPPLFVPVAKIVQLGYDRNTLNFK